ncbi:MAG: hypothetical protein QOH92_1425 [Chloroflexota bacterium]|nr:hypothetical protein [Chloroflexota bacterium]
MRCPVGRIAAFVDDLIQNRRPRRFKASPEELHAIRAAAELAGMRPGADRPDRQFVEHVFASINITVGRVFP